MFAPSDEPHQPFTQPLVAQLQILIGDPERDFSWDKTSKAYRDNVFACQFHPERSGPLGLKILRNFVEWAKKV